MAGELSNVNVNLTANSTDFIVNLKNAQKQYNLTIGKMEAEAKKFSKALTPVTAAIAAFSAAVVLSAQHSLQFNKELNKLSEAAGLTSPQFLAMSEAANTVGVNVDQLGSILGDTEEKIGDFIATGGGGFQDFVDVMRLTEEQAEQTASELQKLSGRDVLIEMVRQMESAGVSAEEMNFALEGMGSESRYLLPLLRDSGSELSNLEERFMSLTSTLDNQTLGALQEAASQTKFLGDNAANFVSQQSQPLIEAYSDIAEAVNRWLSAQVQLTALLGQDDKLFAAEVAALSSVEEAERRRSAEVDSYNSLQKQRIDLEKEIRDFDGSDTRLAGLSSDLTAINQALATSRQNIDILSDRVKDLDIGSSLKKQASESNLDVDIQSSISGAPEVAKGIYDTTEINAYAQELLNIQTQYLTDAESIAQDMNARDVWFGGDPNEILEYQKSQLDMQRDQEIAALDERLKNTEAYEQKKAAIEANYRQQKQILDQTANDLETKDALGVIDGIGNSLGLRFNLEKNYAVAKALLDEQSGLSAALALPFPENVTQSAKVLAESGAIQAVLSSINFDSFEKGSEYIPEDMTALVHKGERVVQADINRDLSNFLTQQKQQGYSNGGGVNISAPLTIQRVNNDQEILKAVGKYPKQIAAFADKGRALLPQQGRR